MKNRVMILGSLEEFVQLVEMAKNRGIYTVVCDGNTDGPAKKFADKSYDIDVRETEIIADVCRREEVDGILTAFSDLLLECMVKISDRAGLPCYLSPDQAVYYRDKGVMKKMFEELGIGTPKFARLRKDFDDEQVKHFRFPVVIKPVDKYGSRGIYVLSEPEEIRKHFDESCSTSEIKEVLVEEYNDGYEFNLMSWVMDGQVYILSIADREKTPVGEHAIPIGTRNVYPTCMMEDVFEEAKNILEKVIQYTGQKNGELSMQFFWKKGQGIEVCEVAARFLGYEHELIEYCSGVSVEEIMLDSIYNPVELREKLKTYDPWFAVCAAVLYFQGRERKISSLVGAERCMRMQEVSEGWLFYKEGETIQEFTRPYAARCYIRADNREKIDLITDEIFQSMSMLDSEGNEILYRNKRVSYENQ